MFESTAVFGSSRITDNIGISYKKGRYRKEYKHEEERIYMPYDHDSRAFAGCLANLDLHLHTVGERASRMVLDGVDLAKQEMGDSLHVSFIYKLSNGVALALVSLLLQLFQYKEAPFLDEETGEVVYSCVQSQTAQDAVRIIFCALPVAIFVISIICAFKADMGRNRFNAIKEELATRR